ncbi:MAG TPA: hypothetical protein VNR60_03310 [Croceibacterium sp.]|nr:hypothetical protein [Croceibacterium sp.]
MKFHVALIATVAALAVAAPAAANEGRAEVRGGIAWAGGNEEAVAGVALGYDFDAGETTFVGVEASADKLLVGGADVVWGATARAGLKLGQGKLFAAGGYSFGDGDAWHLGGGYQHQLTSSTYLKVEYRRYFDVVDVNNATVGVGIRF